MKIVVLGGYGEIGACTSADLAATAKDFDVVVAGRDLEKAERLVSKLHSKNLSAARADAHDKEQMKGVLKGADVLVNATNYYANIDVMKACLASGVDYIDLGGLYHMTLKQLKLDALFRRRGLTAVLGFGSTPGITNVLALAGSSAFDSLSSIHIQFGDKDNTKYNTPFVVPYSMHTVFDEFTEKAPVFSGGAMRFVAPLSGEVNVNFPAPLGRVKCMYAIHSELATMPASFRTNGLRACSFRGGWDEDFIRKTKFLIEAGFASSDRVAVNGTSVTPKNFTVSLMNRFIPTGDVRINDMEFLRVELSGRKSGKQKTVAWYCKTMANKKLNLSAGVWDTGVPPSILAQMMARGEVTTVGAKAPESLDIDTGMFFDELDRRGIEISKRDEPSAERG